MSKPFFALDVDGTVFKSGLVEKVVESCIDTRLFKADSFNEAYSNKQRWQEHNTEGAYLAYLDRLVATFVLEITGVKVEKFQQITDNMVEQQRVRRFIFPRNLLRRLKDSHHSVAISGSPSILVQPFLADLDVDTICGSEYHIENGRFTGVAASVGDKALILKKMEDEHLISRENSVAIGDTVSDKSMLMHAAHPVMFNPSRTLTDYGRVSGWPRVIETKDQVTVLRQGALGGAYVESDMDRLLDDICA